MEVTAEIDGRVLYSALLDYFHATAGMHVFPFPINPIDETSAKYQVGFDGRLYNGWKYKNLPSKQRIKSTGFREYLSNGTLSEEWFGITSPPGGLPDTAVPFYTFDSTPDGVATNFTFLGVINEPILVLNYDGATLVDNRDNLKIFVKEWGMVYASADLASVSRTSMGGYSQAFGLSTTIDDKITHAEWEIEDTNNPYMDMTISWTTVPATQVFLPGGAAKPFTASIDNSVSQMNRFQIYEMIQWFSRRPTNVNTSLDYTVIGKLIRTDFAYFIGDVLYVRAKIVGLLPNDSNFVVFIDDTGTSNTFPSIASGQFVFNSTIQAATGVTYTLLFANPSATVGDEWGKVGAVIVNDKDGVPITGTLPNGTALLNFSFDYGGNVQGGRTGGTDAECYLVMTDANGTSSNMKYLESQVTITSATGQRFLIDGAPNPAYVGV
jgi:hypothetical protein